MKTLLAVALLGLAVSARAEPKSWVQDKIEGQSSDVKEPANILVQSAEEWQKVWRDHFTDPVPAVDFAQKKVVVVFLGEMKAAGVRVSAVVQADPLDSGRVNVFYRPLPVGKGFRALAAATPYVMVKVESTVKTIHVEPDARWQVPEGTKSKGNPADKRKFRALLDGPSKAGFDGR
jgi:hypothetical protein